MIKPLALKALPVAAAGAALFAVACSGSVPAAAAARPSGHAVPHVTWAARPKALSNWAGYIAEGSAGEFTTASADWTVPQVTCLKDSDLYAPWVGIDGDGSQTVEQTGVQTACSSGSPEYSAWYEMYPANPVYFSNPISTGDAFTASVSYSSKGFTLTISDTTQGWTQTVTKKLAAAERLSAEAVIEAPGGYPQISSVNFTNVLFNGAKLKTFSPVKSSSGSGGHVYHPTAITNGDDFSIVPKT